MSKKPTNLSHELIELCLSYLDSDTKWAVAQDPQLRKYLSQTWRDWVKIAEMSAKVFADVYQRPPFARLYLPENGISVGKTKIVEHDMYICSIIEITTPDYREMMSTMLENNELKLFWKDNKVKNVEIQFGCIRNKRIDLFIC